MYYIDIELIYDQNVNTGDEMFWFNTTMVMVDATLKDYENRKAQRIVSFIHLKKKTLCYLHC